MGTDIHLFVEKLIGGKWQPVEPPYDSKYGGKSFDPYHKYGHWDFKEGDPTERNYNVFAFLANVRNGMGFAGVRTGVPVQPQFPERGIPGDTSYTEPKYDDDGEIVSGDSWLGDHSFTHASLTEILSAPWDTEFTTFGVVNDTEFKEWQTNGQPSNWCGGVSGQGIITHQDVIKYANMIDNGEIRNDPQMGCRDYCEVFWKWKPIENCGFIRWAREFLVPISDGNTDSIRVVMGFDS